MTKNDTLRGQISEILKQSRIAAGLTVPETAKALGKSKNTIYSWELGRILPTADVLLQVMVLYGIKDFNVFFCEKCLEAHQEESKPEKTPCDLTDEQRDFLSLIEADEHTQFPRLQRSKEDERHGTT